MCGVVEMNLTRCRGTHPEFLEVLQMAEVFELGDFVVADVHGGQSGLDRGKLNYVRTRNRDHLSLFFFCCPPLTYIVLETLDTLNAVVAQIDLLQALQLFQSFNDRQSVRLDAQDLEHLQGREVLFVRSKIYRQHYAIQKQSPKICSTHASTICTEHSNSLPAIL